MNIPFYFYFYILHTFDLCTSSDFLLSSLLPATPVESHDPLRMKPSYDISPPKVERRGPRINPWPITAPKVGGPNEKETDPHRLAQRQKQIDFGKNTLGYERYLKLVPKDQRGPEHPQTPDIHRVIGRDNFLAECRHWRRQLHVWDPEQSEADGTVAPEAIDSYALLSCYLNCCFWGFFWGFFLIFELFSSPFFFLTCSDLFADMDVDSGAASSSAAAAAPPASSSLSGLNIPDVSEPWE